jgi:alginate export protein
MMGSAPASADDASSNNLMTALERTKPLVDIRLRYEEVEQTGIVDNAHAETLRARLGGETGKFLDTSVLVEGAAMMRLDRDYRPDNAVATYTRFPVVADPENYVLNRLSVTNTTLPQTSLTLGRQRINLDDQRFVGSSNWRQNEVTFDAVRVVNKSVTNLTVDLTFLDKVHRVYGVDSPQGTYKGHSYLGNIAYQWPIGKLTAFAYLLDFDPIAGLTGALDPRRGSTSTYGGRFVGSWPVGVAKIGYVASYAWQKARDDNPLSFSNEYYFGELNFTVEGVKLAGGEEIMQGNGTVGFATPLATLHPFEGWADKFLTTPANGIKDYYGSLGWTGSHLLGLDSLAATAVYHSFEAERVSVSYGSEWDFVLTGKWHHYAALVKYASYTAATATPVAIARNTSKLWAQLEYIW